MCYAMKILVNVKECVGLSFPCRNPTPYCRPCEAFTSDNDAMVEAGSEFPAGGKRKWGRKPTKNEPVAQSVEHSTFNAGVVGSSPTWLTKGLNILPSPKTNVSRHLKSMVALTEQEASVLYDY